MTCGICNPQGFRDAWQDSNPIKGKSPRVWGYAVARDACAIASQTKTLLYRGAEHVLADLAVGQVRRRPGFQILTNPVYLRSGDTLLLAHKHALGTNLQRSGFIEEEMQARGVAVWEVVAQDESNGCAAGNKDLRDGSLKASLVECQPVS